MTFEDFFSDAAYVSAPNDTIYPYIRKEFYIGKKIRRAVLSFSILGFGEIYINGNRVGGDILYFTPYSQYNAQKRTDVNEVFREDPFFDDKLGYSVYVSQFEVGEYLKKGKNCLTAILAGGWYRSGNDVCGNYRNYGILKLAFRLVLEFEDGEIEQIVSDCACKCKSNFLIVAGVFEEKQDERREIPECLFPEYDDSEWERAIENLPPPSVYRLVDFPYDKIKEILTPRLLKSENTFLVYDTGKNTSGFPILRSDSSAGRKIVVEYFEKLTPKGEPDYKHFYGQRSVFITDSRIEHFIRFTWHGFRYFKISCEQGVGDIFCDACAVVRSDVDNHSSFQSDSDVLNWIYESYVNSQLTNFHCGVPTDCPHIERKGYTGDGQLLCDLGLLLFNSQNLYRKWMRDIFDAQDEKTGFVHYTAPCFVGCAGGPGGWSSAAVVLPYMFYKITGDLTVLKEYYPAMKNYVHYMCSESADYIVCLNERNSRMLGDWNSPGALTLSSSFVNTCLFADVLDKISLIAEILGVTEDKNHFEVLRRNTLNSIIKYFMNRDTGNFCKNINGANAFALWIGLGNKKTKENLVAKYSENMQIDTGIFGTKILIEILFRLGYGDLAAELLTSEKEISYFKWKEDGATTLYENWINARSLNHPMFGSVTITFFEYMLGIRQNVNRAGFDQIEISPVLIKKICRLQGEIETVKGKISVCYMKSKDNISFKIYIPNGVTAVFKLLDEKKVLVCGQNVFDIAL